MFPYTQTLLHFSNHLYIFAWKLQNRKMILWTLLQQASSTLVWTILYCLSNFAKFLANINAPILWQHTSVTPTVGNSFLFKQLCDSVHPQSYRIKVIEVDSTVRSNVAPWYNCNSTLSYLFTRHTAKNALHEDNVPKALSCRNEKAHKMHKNISRGLSDYKKILREAS